MRLQAEDAALVANVAVPKHAALLCNSGLTGTGTVMPLVATAVPTAQSAEKSERSSDLFFALSAMIFNCDSQIKAARWIASKSHSCGVQVKRWDTETTACVDTLSGSRALYCIAAAPDDQQVVAFGGADKALRLWDARVRHGEKQVRTICVQWRCMSGRSS